MRNGETIGPALLELPRTEVRPPNIGSWEEARRGFDWAVAERELGWGQGDPVNIGWNLSDRICRLGLAQKPALLWEGADGQERRYTFDDLRVLSNTIAEWLGARGVGPGERICLFLDRVPELYLAFVGILKLGAVVQPLFSAFGDESLATRLLDAGTCCIVTQKKHLPKVRRARATLADLRLVVVVDAGETKLAEGEVAFNLDTQPRVESYDVFPAEPETPSVLHYTSGTTGQPKGAQHVHRSLLAQYLTTKWV
ncbi:MAG TPA: AMP-binding protein, partial [Thermoanaerobaculia bacterium]|nr:AMP-binding protein [Thermoanaerobaculia bacterium]